MRSQVCELSGLFGHKNTSKRQHDPIHRNNGSLVLSENALNLYIETISESSNQRFFSEIHKALVRIASVPDKEMNVTSIFSTTGKINSINFMRDSAFSD